MEECQGERMNVLHQLIDSLPASWTPAERERWLRAIAAAVDYAVEVNA